MRKLYVIVVALIGFKAAAQTNPRLAKTIDSLYKVDQSVQLKLKELFEQSAPADSIKKQEALKNETFVRNIQIVKDIYAKYGYPTFKMIGKETSNNFFVLIQHADKDLAFQQQVLPVLDKISKKGQALRRNYAYLYDRVQRNSGGKQLYGTQLTFSPQTGLFDANNKIVYPPDLADPEHVNARRKSVGLEPIEEYYEKTAAFLGWKRPQSKN